MSPMGIEKGKPLRSLVEIAQEAFRELGVIITVLTGLHGRFPRIPTYTNPSQARLPTKEKALPNKPLVKQ